MKFVGIRKQENFVMLRYETVWPVGWQSLLDIMQVFLNDIKVGLQLVQYLPIAGAEGVDIKTITEGLLYKTEELKEEKGGVSLAGHSRLMETPIRITMYNQLRIVDVQIPLVKSDVAEAFEKSDRVFDNYMDSLEINGYCRAAERSGIDLFSQYNVAVASEDNELKEQIDKKIKNICEDLGVNPCLPVK